MTKGNVLRIGTRESQLAVWQANLVKDLLAEHGFAAELVYIKSEGDIDLQTPLYEMGVQGIFTRSLDMALLTNRIDIAVHSMKDVPTRLPERIVQAAVLKRASYKDVLVFKGERSAIEEALEVSGGEPGELSYVSGEPLDVSRQSADVRRELAVVSKEDHLNSQTTADIPLTNPNSLKVHNSPLSTHHSPLTIATSSIRRIAQWLHRYPHHTIENLRGNVNSRLRKVDESHWHGAIFAAAGLERINLRPAQSIDLDWMLPAPAQGAIMVVCKKEDDVALDACRLFNDADTALCTKVEKDFLRELMGGCSTPISALAQIHNGEVFFRGNIFSTDGKEKAEIARTVSLAQAQSLGTEAAQELLQNGGQSIFNTIQNERK